MRPLFSALCKGRIFNFIFDLTIPLTSRKNRLSGIVGVLAAVCALLFLFAAEIVLFIFLALDVNRGIGSVCFCYKVEGFGIASV